jgi:hypothetical protein
MVGPVSAGKPAQEFAHPPPLVSGPFRLLIQRECKINIVQDRPALVRRDIIRGKKINILWKTIDWRHNRLNHEAHVTCVMMWDQFAADSTPFGRSGQRSASANPALPQLGSANGDQEIGRLRHHRRQGSADRSSVGNTPKRQPRRHGTRTIALDDPRHAARSFRGLPSQRASCRRW